MKIKKSKLSLDEFKSKLGDQNESLELISGGILGACHDDPKKPAMTGNGTPNIM